MLAIATKEALDGSDGWSLAETNVGQMAFYLQDEWFVNDKFKLTYGIRMDKPLYFDSDEKAQDVIDGTGDYAQEPLCKSKHWSGTIVG